VWAAGVVVWELVTGRKLYDHEDDVATLLSVVTEEPPRLAQVLQGVPASLDEAVAYALTSDVSRRCPSAETLRCMLESAWDECGGMATPTELGAFVRQTVGHKLAERRTFTLRGRPASSPDLGVSPPSAVPAAGGTNPGVAGAREDGTKTAISAAVPAAEHRNEPSPFRPWRRSLGWGVGAAAALLVVAIGVAITRPTEVVRATPIPATALPGSATSPLAAVPAVPEMSERHEGSGFGAPLEVRDLPEEPAGGEPDGADGKKRDGEADISATGSGRGARRASIQHAKGTTHRLRSRTGQRPSG